MGFYIICDDEADRAVIYDSLHEQPLRGASFLGANARMEGESFLGYLATRHNQNGARTPEDRMLNAHTDDPRYYSEQRLSQAHDRWRELCLDEHDNLNDYGTRLAEWLWGSQRDPAPEPRLTGVK